MLIFPPSLAEHDANRPVIMFKRETQNEKDPNSTVTPPMLEKTIGDVYIVFPIPQSIQFQDSAAYNNSELGFTGGMILAAGRGRSVDEAVSNAASFATASVPNSFKSVAQLLSSQMGGTVKSAVGVATGITLNKNIVTEFTGVGTRQFSFQFKLMAKTQQEVARVKQIVDEFRLGLYPAGNNIQLTYPPTWSINFMQGKNEIKEIPKPFQLYLTNLSTNMNSTVSLFHVNGAPVETDIQLTFIETRALVRDDIRTLIKRPFKESDFLKQQDSSAEINSKLEQNKKIEDQIKQFGDKPPDAPVTNAVQTGNHSSRGAILAAQAARAAK